MTGVEIENFYKLDKKEYVLENNKDFLKVYKKMEGLALVRAWPIRLNGFYKYYKMDIYLLKGFNEFIDLLENGKIKVLFKIGNNYNKGRYGKVDSRGIGFVIQEDDFIGKKKLLYEI